MIKYSYLTNEQLNNEAFENTVFFSIAEGGAMGEPGAIKVLTTDKKYYKFNYCYGDTDLNLIYKYFPVLGECEFGMFGLDSKVPSGWNYVNLGMGNHLIVADSVYKEFADKTKDLKSPPEFYQKWEIAAEEILGNTGHGKQSKKTQLIKVFEDTVDYYNTNQILKDAVTYGRANTKLYGEDDYPELPDLGEPRRYMVYVSHSKTFEAAMRLAKENPDKKVAVLNFASAVRPGGGVKNGSSAQEESLCRCSTLFPTIDRKWLWSEYYDANRAAKNVVHTDACIYSPGVIICKTDESIPQRMEERDFVKVDVISCAAPNLMREPANEHNPETGKPVRMNSLHLYDIHVKRAHHILHVAAYNKVDILVLGAFGCGAFRNDPATVAKAYRDALNAYADRFDIIEFAIYSGKGSTENYDAFAEYFYELELFEDGYDPMKKSDSQCESMVYGGKV